MDLHEIQIRDEATGGKSTIYVITFFDDAIRLITHYRLIDDKRSDTCVTALAQAVEMWAAPCMLGIDDGGEVAGAVSASILQKYDVSHWRTTTHTPQRKGKRERFWGSLESFRKGGFSERLIADIVGFYNTATRHSCGHELECPNAVVNVTISNDLIWAPQSQKSWLMSRLPYDV
jgi:transposase InsO family protein